MKSCTNCVLTVKFYSGSIIIGYIKPDRIRWKSKALWQSTECLCAPMGLLLCRLAILLFLCLFLGSAHSYAAELTFPLNPNGKVYTNDLLPVNCSFKTKIKGNKVQCSVRKKGDSDWQQFSLSKPNNLLQKGERQVVGYLWVTEDGHFLFSEPAEIQIRLLLQGPSKKIKDKAIRSVQVIPSDMLESVNLRIPPWITLYRFLLTPPSPDVKKPLADLEKSLLQKIERFSESKTNVGILCSVALQSRRLMRKLEKVWLAADRRIRKKHGSIIKKKWKVLHAAAQEAVLREKEIDLTKKLRAYEEYLEQNINNFMGAKFYPHLILMSCGAQDTSFATNCFKKYYKQHGFKFRKSTVRKKIKKTEALVEEGKK